MVKSAFLKLITVYMVFVIAISFLFSVVLYQVSITALQRGLRGLDTTAPISLRLNNEFENFRKARFKEQKSQVLSSIIFLNITIILAGALISYYLAKKTLQPIQQAIDRQTRFTADAAHELRTPLSVMRAENEVSLRDKNLTKSDAIATIESNLEEVIRMQALTETLLALSSNNSDDHKTNFNIKDSVGAVTERLNNMASAKKITIKDTTSKSLAYGNIDNIEQIITILLENAIKYSPENSLIELKSQKSKNNTNILIVDHGYGIDKNDEPYIFDRFYRGEKARTRSSINGHGLGLSLAKQLAENNDAYIKYQPTKKGGSTFILNLKKASDSSNSELT
jgi:signal transduction histidine kinase